MIRFRARSLCTLRKDLPGFEERAENRAAREALAEGLEQEFVDLVEAFTPVVDAKLEPGMVTQIPPGSIADALEFERLESDLGALLERKFNEAIEAGGEIGARFSPPSIDLPASVVTEAAVAWIEERSLASAAQLAQTSREAIRDTLIRALRDQITPEDAARRIGRAVGLTPKQATALENYRRNLERQLMPDGGPGIPGNRNARRVIERETEKYRRRLLRARGRAIADTEMQAAIQHGERLYWVEADRQGLIERETVLRVWKTVLDGRVCALCAPLHNHVVGFDQVFVGANGIAVGPPIHVACRCYVVYDVPASRAA